MPNGSCRDRFGAGGSGMSRRDGDSTSITLLARLREEPANAEVWQEFVRRYRPRIYASCLAWHLQPADADDVTQVVLVRLVEKLRDFRYDPSQSFRGWLKVVTRRTLSDYLAKARREPGGGDSAVQRMLENVEARESVVQAVEQAYDRELLDEALRRVRQRVPEQQWEAFRLTALESVAGAEVSRRLGMRVSTVYSSRSKVQKQVREELERLEQAVQ